MKPVTDVREKLDADGAAAEHGHDAWLREKVARGLAQSRDRDAMIPVEEVLRELPTI